MQGLLLGGILFCHHALRSVKISGELEPDRGLGVGFGVGLGLGLGSGLGVGVEVGVGVCS